MDILGSSDNEKERKSDSNMSREQLRKVSHVLTPSCSVPLCSVVKRGGGLVWRGSSCCRGWRVTADELMIIVEGERKVALEGGRRLSRGRGAVEGVGLLSREEGFCRGRRVVVEG